MNTATQFPRPRFAASREAVAQRLNDLQPVNYGRTRNFVNGQVSYLSPYISRGVLSTKKVLQYIKEQGHDLKQCEKFVQELAWRDYWQEVWRSKGDTINRDLKRPQPDARFSGIPVALQNAQTGIEAIDEAVKVLYETGYMHNHLRMYVAALACNVARCHWHNPAQWMYYHLLDGDWASNALSWQWVAGSNSGKKYVANQENINRYTGSTQRRTFLDIPYEDFEQMAIPPVLSDVQALTLRTELPETPAPELKPDLPLLVYHSYHLDPDWHADLEANRVLLLEPELFERYPVSERVLGFILDCAKLTQGLQVYCGSFSSLQKIYGGQDIRWKDHPLCAHYIGTPEAPDRMFPVTGYFPSFFAFWKQCQKHIAW